MAAVLKKANVSCIIITVLLLFSLNLMSCIGQNPSMAHMMFIEPEIGGTFGKGQRINNRADFKYLLSNYEVGIYSGTLPRIGFEMGTRILSVYQPQK